jgi:hypothetical protein
MPDHEGFENRPEVMKVLGLLPPYAVEDVNTAYEEKLAALQKEGTAGQVARNALRAACESALDFARFRESRRSWIGNHILRYTARQAVADRIREMGGRFVLQDVSRYLWLYGPDFAEIMRQLVYVELTGSGITDASLDVFSDEQVAHEIVMLELRGSAISDVGLSKISHLQRIRCLDLANTPITGKSFQTLCSFPHLEWVRLHGTRIGFWTKFRLRSRLGLQIADEQQTLPPTVYEAAYEYAQIVDRIAELQ